MKLLFDQNISYRIIKNIKSIYSESAHVSLFGLQTSDDNSVWEFAQKNNYTLVTQDADFYDISLLKGFPPKIIWLRCGNTSTNNIQKILLEQSDIIISFIKDDQHACIEII